MRIESSEPVDQASRPNGIGLSALVLCCFAATGFVGAFIAARGPGKSLLTSEHLPGLVSSIFLFGIAVFTAWNYWKGRDWARVVVLVGCFLIALGALSRVLDHDGNLVVIMSHPLLFLRLMAALFLLYWLNTGPVRAWFKSASSTAADLISACLAGRVCTAVEESRDGLNSGWHLAFEHDAELMLNCPWRIALDDNLAFASNSKDELLSDDELPQRLLQNLRVKNVRVTPRSSDLFVTFEMGLELQTWSIDRHAQQWMFSDPALTVVADSDGLNAHTIVESTAKDSARND